MRLDHEMQVTMTLATVERSSDLTSDQNKTDNMTDITPKRTSAIVQPMPRRLLPSHPVPCFMPKMQTTHAMVSELSNRRECELNISTSNTSDSSQNLSSPESSPRNLHSTVLRPIQAPKKMSPLLDFSTRRRTAFSVTDLLARTESTKSEFRMPQVYDTSIPSSHFPYDSPYTYTPKLEMPKHTELPVQVKEETSPGEELQLQNPSPIRPFRSLTSSPESPKSDTSVSDRSDPNNSTDPDTSPNIYKTSLDKKSNRTNYTPIQVRSLEKVFLENPYPEHEVYEQLSKDLSIPEPRLKVWFQNKRARWKRRAEDKMTTPSVYPFPMVPMGYPYGMMPGAMTSPTEPSSRPHSMYPYAAAPAGLMIYPGPGGYPTSLYPYLHHQMYVQH